MTPGERSLTVKELADELQLARDTVYRKANDGTIPGIKLGGAWRFYLSEVVEACRPKKVDLWEQPARARRGRAA